MLLKLKVILSSFLTNILAQAYLPKIYTICRESVAYFHTWLDHFGRILFRHFMFLHQNVIVIHFVLLESLAFDVIILYPFNRYSLCNLFFCMQVLNVTFGKNPHSGVGFFGSNLGDWGSICLLDSQVF